MAPKNHDFLFKFIFSMQCSALTKFSIYPNFYQNCYIIMKVDVKVSTRVALSFLKNIKCTFSNDLDPHIVTNKYHIQTTYPPPNKRYRGVASRGLQSKRIARPKFVNASRKSRFQANATVYLFVQTKQKKNGEGGNAVYICISLAITAKEKETERERERERGRM